MRLLVTGGAGYIGSITAEALLEAGHTVVIYDNLSTGHRAAVPDGAVFLEGDLRDEQRLEAILADNAIDAVFHFAGRSLVGESMEQPGRYLRENILGGLALLEAMVKAKVHRLVYSSSCAIFGIPRRLPIEEDDPKEPVSPYGESKLVLERALRWYGERHGIRSISLRYFNAAGATDRLGEAHRPETHLIPLLLQAAARERGPIPIYGTDYPTPDGTCIRDYIHALDLADAHLLGLGKLEQGLTLAYNLGSGRGYSVRDVIKTAEAVTGLPIPFRERPRRTGDPPALVASTSRIRQELGWAPKRGLKEIIESAWRWRRAHPQSDACTEGQRVSGRSRCGNHRDVDGVGNCSSKAAEPGRQP